MAHLRSQRTRGAEAARPRTKPPHERRDDLMNAAEQLFLKNGVEPTTVEQITRAADVAKGTFYLHFSSKEEIRVALGDRFSQQLLAKVKTAIDQRRKDDWRGKLATWAAACVTGYLDSIEVHDVLFYSSRPPTREGLVQNSVIDLLADLLQAGGEARAWSMDEPRAAAVFIFSGLHAVVDDAYSRNRQVNLSRLVKRIEHLCFRTVGLD